MKSLSVDFNRKLKKKKKKKNKHENENTVKAYLTGLYLKSKLETSH